jgi:hypothetical protein
MDSILPDVVQVRLEAPHRVDLVADARRDRPLCRVHDVPQKVLDTYVATATAIN